MFSDKMLNIKLVLIIDLTLNQRFNKLHSKYVKKYQWYGT